MSAIADVLEAGRDEIVRRLDDARAAGAPEGGDSSSCSSSASSSRELLDALVAALRSGQPGEPAAAAGAPRETVDALPARVVSTGGELGVLAQDHVALDGIVFQILEESGATFEVQEMRMLFAHLVNGITAAAAGHIEAQDERTRRQAAKHVAFLAHELRNPLSSMFLAFYGLKKTGVVPEAHRNVIMLDRGFTRLRNLIDGALIEVKLSSVAEPDLCEMDLSPFLAELIEEMVVNAEQKGVTVEVDCRATELTADPKYIHSALSNLLRNAIKFSRRGAVVRLQVRQEAQRVVFEVEDECGGLKQEALEKLFNPFVQAGSDRTGFGLGLAIARQAVEAHHGTLRVHDHPGRGCTFSMNLPVDGRATSAATAP